LTCYLFISSIDGDEIVLGILFQTQFYMEYDYEKGRIGLAQAAKGEKIRGNSVKGLRWWGWLMACCLIICTLAFLYLLYQLLVPKRIRKHKKAAQRQLRPVDRAKSELSELVTEE